MTTKHNGSSRRFNSDDWRRLIYALLGFLLGSSDTINTEPFAIVAQSLLGY